MRTIKTGCRQSGERSGRIAPGVVLLTLLAAATAAYLTDLVAAPVHQGPVRLSIVGTSDLHGEAFPRALSGVEGRALSGVEGRGGPGGLPLLAGYVNNLRAARAADGGAVLLIDAGDTYQGNVESNLSEGALVVDAFNAMGYTAKAVGNHDFDFGSIDSPMARQLPGDLRGALKARAAQARHPFLAANLMDSATGRHVNWPNIQPSVLIEAAGVKVGIVGVLTIDALRSTIAANVQGLHVAPLESTVADEAANLRAAGAEVVIVAAHAGGRCDRFDRPDDLSSCDVNSEIFQLARSVPRGLVDVIVAGHTHAGLGHQVEGIGIIQPYSRGQWFGRVDVIFDPAARRVARLQLFPPRQVCSRQDPATGNCAAAGGSGVAAEYEGRPVTPDSVIVRAMEPELGRVHALQAVPLGAAWEKAIPRIDAGGTPLGHLVAEALREAVPGADVAAINNAGRLWSDLPAGPLTFGQLYNVFPFDNRIAQVSLTGAELVRWLANEIARRGTVGISGVDVQVRCMAGAVDVDLFRGTEPVDDNERLLGVTIGAPTLNGNLASPDFLGGAGPTGNSPVAREVVEDWFRKLGRLTPAERDRVLAPRPAIACPNQNF